MGDVRSAVSWGRAERDALDRCLSAARSIPAQAPVRPPRLTRVIESEIIPRLMLAHQTGAERHEPVPEISSGDVGAFTRTVLEGSVGDALQVAEAFGSRGIPYEIVLLELLGATARLLGDMWRADLCSFAEVSIGMSRLQGVLRELERMVEAEYRPEPCGQILLLPTPGDQHTFGVSVLDGFFRRAGWDVHGGSGCRLDEALDVARDVWLDAIGLSLGGDVLFPGACSSISALRAASRNPSVVVMVGGRFFCDCPDRAAEAGADAVAADAPDALRIAGVGLGIRLANG